MGLFDKVLKKAVGDVLGDKANELLTSLTGQDAGEQGRGDYPAQQIPQDDWQGTRRDAWQGTNRANQFGERPPFQRKDHTWFAAMLQENFSDYHVREYVPVGELGGDGKAYDFLLVKDGRARGVLMLTEHNKTNNRAFKGAQAACEAAGVPFINFFLHMANEPDYVINRVRNSLL